jgi:hypothetical protein
VRPVPVVLAPQGRDQPSSTSPPICCKYTFQVFEMFQRYVTGVSYGCCKSRLGCYICCKCLRGMLQSFIQNVSSISDLFCKHFLSECCTCFTTIVQEYVRNVAAVSSVLSGCCIYFTHMLQSYVQNVLFASFVCCIQVFHVSDI